MVNIAVVGASGKMGQTICSTILKQTTLKLKQAHKLSFVSSIDYINKDIGSFLGLKKTGLKIAKTIDDSIQNNKVNFDVLIDFTTPQATINHLNFCQKQRKAIVIGTTGFNQEQKTQIKNASSKIPIVFAPNMSIGVNVFFKTIEFLAQNLDENYDTEIIEAHHRDKVDSPSGTALKMGEIISHVRKSNFNDDAQFRTKGIIGKRQTGKIGYSVIRAADIVGNHSVLFATDGEQIEISHRSFSRLNYAKGAILAAHFCWQKQQNQSTGLFDMFDVLNLKDN